jgi:glycosyltransferase involved in cell wall biosynthesis
MKKKVLHIITRLDKGGSSTNTLWTVALLPPERYDVTLLSGRTSDPRGEVAQFIRTHGLRVIFVDELRREIHPWLDLKALVRITGIIRRGKYDVVHTHCSKGGILGRWAAFLAGVRGIVHTPHGHIFYGYFGRLQTLGFLWVERVTALVTRRIITLTGIGKEEHVKLGIAPPEKFTAIPSGIDMDLFKPDPGTVQGKRQELSIPRDAQLVGTVARLDPVKGVGFLIEAMNSVCRELPQARLLVVGDGSEKAAYEKMVRDLGMARSVIFTGFAEDVAVLLGSMDVFVLPSLNEGMGRVILEAMACRKPVIASCVGGIPELVQDGVTGLLVPPADPQALSLAILALLRSPGKAGTLAENGYRSLGERYTLAAMVKTIDGLYQEISGGKI